MNETKPGFGGLEMIDETTDAGQETGVTKHRVKGTLSLHNSAQRQ